jgi:PhzF family phenazine biosynthesis protein
MRGRRFVQLDVFAGAAANSGNGLAVVLDGEPPGGLDAAGATAAMQAFADWTQLSETTFLLPPTPQAAAAGADYRVRIFCPGRELPFAGHPTLGSAAAWRHAGGVPQQPGVVVQECGVGLVPVRIDDTVAGRLHAAAQPLHRLHFAAPPLRRGEALTPEQSARLAAACGVPLSAVAEGRWCDNGPPWQALRLVSATAVRAARIDPLAARGLDIGLVGPHADPAAAGGIAFEVRAFFTGAGGHVAEDPVTGSLNAAIAIWLIDAGLAPPRYVAAQGGSVGRAGRVHVERADDGRTWIGGDVAVVVEGAVHGVFGPEAEGFA